MQGLSSHMGSVYKSIIRPILFKADPESAHNLAAFALAGLGYIRPMCKALELYNLIRTEKPINVFGVNFPNHVGLAAGMDKNATFWRTLAGLGFGHFEVGTVTFHGQPGNPKPRAFRFPEQEAIINRMGFNNAGAEKIAKRIKRQRGAKTLVSPLGINIGKSKVTSLEEAAQDYIGSFNLLADYADFITLNVSSPNTPGLRELQKKEHLRDLLKAIMDNNYNWAAQRNRSPMPILLKVAPDLSFPEIDNALEVLLDLKYAGIVATNTTISRPAPFSAESEVGGLSGAPIDDLSTKIINYISKATEGKFPIIGVGGIMDEASAGRKMDAGASLVQLYTGFIYNGPFFAKKIAFALKRHSDAWA